MWMSCCMFAHLKVRVNVPGSAYSYALSLHTLGLKRQEDGALVKDYTGPEAETEQAVQLALMKVGSEDPRFLEQPPAPLDQEYPVGSNVFFLGEHTYGAPSLVKGTADNKASLMIVVSHCDNSSHPYLILP